MVTPPLDSKMKQLNYQLSFMVQVNEWTQETVKKKQSLPHSTSLTTNRSFRKRIICKIPNLCSSSSKLSVEMARQLPSMTCVKCLETPSSMNLWPKNTLSALLAQLRRNSSHWISSLMSSRARLDHRPTLNKRSENKSCKNRDNRSRSKRSSFINKEKRSQMRRKKPKFPND